MSEEIIFSLATLKVLNTETVVAAVLLARLVDLVC
jgi:hypothetical protein